MRRGVAANLVAGPINDVFEVSAGRAFAVGAADRDHRAMLCLAKRRLDAADALQPQLNTGLPLGVQAFQMLQPVFFSHQLSVVGDWSLDAS